MPRMRTHHDNGLTICILWLIAVTVFNTSPVQAGVSRIAPEKYATYLTRIFHEELLSSSCDAEDARAQPAENAGSKVSEGCPAAWLCGEGEFDKGGTWEVGWSSTCIRITARAPRRRGRVVQILPVPRTCQSLLRPWRPASPPSSPAASVANPPVVR